jgi:hypothetical protein
VGTTMSPMGRNASGLTKEVKTAKDDVIPPSSSGELLGVWWPRRVGALQ